MRRGCLLVVATLASAVAGCSGRQSGGDVHLAVWQYQLASFRGSIGRGPVCIGVRGASTGAVLDPAAELVAALNQPKVRVMAASACHAGFRGFILGPVDHHRADEARVEGSAVDGTYQYHLERQAGRWKVVSGAMLTVY